VQLVDHDPEVRGRAAADGAAQGASAAAVPPFEGRLVGAVAAGQVVLHLLYVRMYGLNAADLHQLAQGRRLAWGYVDTMPLTPFLYRVVSEVFGVSSMSLHAVPILVGAGLVVLAAALAREMGGGRWAQGVCALAAAIGPVFLGSTQFMFPQTFDLLFTALASLVLIRLVRTGERRLWIPFGFVLGLGLLNKLTIAVWAAATLIALLVGRHRRLLLTPWFAAGCAGAAAMFLPSTVWLVTHRDVYSKFVESQPQGWGDFALFCIMPILAATPIAALIWARGLRPPPDADGRRPMAFLGVAAAITAASIWVIGANPFHSVALLLPLLAAGAVAIERTGGGRQRTALATGIAAVGVAMVPLITTILPEDVVYDSGIGRVFNLEYFMGYRDVAEDIAAAFHTLPPSDQSRATLLTYTSNEAAVVEFWSDELRVPKPISPENNYALWGPSDAADDAPVLVAGFQMSDLDGHFEGCRRIGTIGADGRPMDPNERGRPIAVCDSPTRPWSEIWPEIVRYERI